MNGKGERVMGSREFTLRFHSLMPSGLVLVCASLVQLPPRKANQNLRGQKLTRSLRLDINS